MLTKMKVYKRPVRVTGSTPVDAPASELFYYNAIDRVAVIHPIAVAQSVVLSSLLESSGGTGAQLQRRVTISAFELWQKAVVDQELGEYTRHRIDMGDICRILKAADGVGDVKFDEWAELAWSLLDNTERSVFKQITEESDVKCFLKLPEHIQFLVFMAGSRSSNNPKTVDSLLNRLPQKVQPSLLAAFAGPEKKLVVPDTCGTNLNTFFSALLSLPAAPPSVQVLIDSDLESQSRGSNDRDCDKIAETAAAVFRHHSGLTSLKLSQACCSPLQMQHVAPSLAALPDLSSLHLGSSRFSLGTKALSVLGDAFQSPHPLQHMELTVECEVDKSRDDTVSSRATKSRRTETSSTAPDAPATENEDALDHKAAHSECIARFLSRLTCLTFLSITSGLFTWEQYDIANVSIPINMPHLETLHLPGYHSLLPVNVVSNLTAPLKTLSIEIRHRQSTQHVSAPPCPQKLCSSLLQFEHLTSLSLKLAVIRDASFDRTLCTELPPAFANLRHLKHLEFGASFPVMLAGLESVVPDICHLTCAITRMSSQQVAEATSQWTRLFALISRMRLAHLDVAFPDTFEHQPLPGLVHLSALTGLTALSLQTWGSCIDQPADRAALTQMSKLQSLRITGIEPEPAVLSRTFELVASLRLLTKLVVRARSETREEVLAHQDDDLVHDVPLFHVPPGAWQSLKHMVFPVVSRRSARALTRSVIRLPGLVELHLQGVKQAVVSKYNEKNLEEYAEERGVKLLMPEFRRPGVFGYDSDESAADVRGF